MVDDEGVPLTEPVSQSELHTTWRNLANEQVMFPLDMKSMPVKIGHERELFVGNISSPRPAVSPTRYTRPNGSPKTRSSIAGTRATG